MEQIRAYYQIAEKVLELRLPFPYLDMEEYQTYRVEDCEADVTVSFVEEAVKLPQTDQIFDVGYNRVRQTEDAYFYELLCGDMQSTYGCLVLPKQETHHFTCYLYENARKYLPHATQVFKAISIEHLLNCQKRYILHASYILWREKAVLFSAPSGTGKTTQAELWEQYANAEIINGDRAAIGEGSDGIMAYGLPYAGSSSIFKNVSASIGAIVVLRQSSENQIRRVAGSEAVKYLYAESVVHSWDKIYLERLMALLIKTVEQVPVFLLNCRPDQEAVETLKRELENIYGISGE